MRGIQLRKKMCPSTASHHIVLNSRLKYVLSRPVDNHVLKLGEIDRVVVLRMCGAPAILHDWRMAGAAAVMHACMLALLVAPVTGAAAVMHACMLALLVAPVTGAAAAVMHAWTIGASGIEHVDSDRI